VTVALWRQAGDQQWHHGPATFPRAWQREYADPDGSNWLFAQLDGRADSYLEYASYYFERELAADAVIAVINHDSITAALVRALNPARLPDDLTDDLNQIGYPKLRFRGRSDGAVAEGAAGAA
jgi:hypothetical protein